MSHVTCERCQGHEHLCLKCGKGWGPWTLHNRDHTSQRRDGRCRLAIRRRDRVPCGEKHTHSFYRCDGCQTDGPIGDMPSSWAGEWVQGGAYRLHLCGNCVARKAVAMDAAFDGGLLQPRDPTAALLKNLAALDPTKPLDPNLVAAMRRVLARDGAVSGGQRAVTR